MGDWHSSARSHTQDLISPRVPRLPDIKPRVVDGQYRVVLPPQVRAALGIDRGDHVTFEVDGADVRLRRVRWV